MPAPCVLFAPNTGRVRVRLQVMFVWIDKKQFPHVGREMAEAGGEPLACMHACGFAMLACLRTWPYNRLVGWVAGSRAWCLLPSLAPPSDFAPFIPLSISQRVQVCLQDLINQKEARSACPRLCEETRDGALTAPHHCIQQLCTLH